MYAQKLHWQKSEPVERPEVKLDIKRLKPVAKRSKRRLILTGKTK